MSIQQAFCILFKEAQAFVVPIAQNSPNFSCVMRVVYRGIQIYYRFTVLKGARVMLHFQQSQVLLWG
jgi:hypothetical protein